MADKLLIPCLYLQSGKAVTGFGQRNLFGDGNIENLVRFYRDNGADELLIFDISSGDTEHEQAISNIKSICSAAEIPVMAAGNINRMEDVKKLLYAGCAKVVLNFSKANNISLLEEVSKRFGKEKMAVCISSTEEFTANQALIESFADEVLALDTIQDEIHACSSIKIILHTEVSKTAALKSLLQKDSVYALSGAYISSLDISLQDFKADCKADGIPVVTFESAIAWADFKLNSDGLIPVVVQDCKTDQVLMVAYMNEEAFNNTLKTGKMTYWSRSRQELWLKGLTSGHFQYVKSLALDCDNDTILAKVDQIGAPAIPAAEAVSSNLWFRRNPTTPIRFMYFRMYMMSSPTANFIRRKAPTPTISSTRALTRSSKKLAKSAQRSSLLPRTRTKKKSNTRFLIFCTTPWSSWSKKVSPGKRSPTNLPEGR